MSNAVVGADGTRAPLAPHGFCAILVWAAVSLLALTPAWRPVELALHDLLNTLDPLEAQDTPLVIVAVDEPSFADFGLSWPWPRALHARLLDRLTAAGARVVAFDMMFSEPGRPDDDRALAEAIARAPAVVLASTQTVIRERQATTRLSLVPLPELIVTGARVGDVRLPLDADGVSRRVPDEPGSFWQQVLTLAGSLPSAAGTARLIRYAGPPRTLPTVSYYQALDPDTFLPPGVFRDRIVLVGLSLEAAPTPEEQQADMVATPLMRTTGAFLSGVEAQATIIEAARQGHTVGEAPAWSTPMILAACSLLLLAAATATQPGRMVALAALLTVAIPELTASVPPGIVGARKARSPSAGGGS